MTDKATINGGPAEQAPADGSGMQRSDRLIAILRSVLSGTRLLDRVVRSLSRRINAHVPYQETCISSLLLKPKQALMLAGIRSAGAEGGGPGH